MLIDYLSENTRNVGIWLIIVVYQQVRNWAETTLHYKLQKDQCIVYQFQAY